MNLTESNSLPEILTYTRGWRGKIHETVVSVTEVYHDFLEARNRVQAIMYPPTKILARELTTPAIPFAATFLHSSVGNALLFGATVPR